MVQGENEEVEGEQHQEVFMWSLRDMQKKNII